MAGLGIRPMPAVFYGNEPNMKLSRSTTSPPGDLAIWIFIAAELLVFAVFFASYAFTRASHVDLFNHFQLQLDRNLALINTLLLITSSYFVVRALAAMREEDRRQCVGWLMGALAMGALFLVIKFSEYAHLCKLGSDQNGTYLSFFGWPYFLTFSFACSLGKTSKG